MYNVSLCFYNIFSAMIALLVIRFRKPTNKGYI